MQPLKGGAGDERTAVRHSGRPQQLVSSFPSLRLLVFFTSSVLLLMLRSTFFLPRLMLFKWRTSYFSFPAVHMLSAVLRWSTQLVTQTALTAAAFVRYTWTPFIIQRTQTKLTVRFLSLCCHDSPTLYSPASVVPHLSLPALFLPLLSFLTSPAICRSFLFRFLLRTISACLPCYSCCWRAVSWTEILLIRVCLFFFSCLWKNWGNSHPKIFIYYRAQTVTHWSHGIIFILPLH